MEFARLIFGSVDAHIYKRSFFSRNPNVKRDEFIRKIKIATERKLSLTETVELVISLNTEYGPKLKIVLPPLLLLKCREIKATPTFGPNSDDYSFARACKELDDSVRAIISNMCVIYRTYNSYNKEPIVNNFKSFVEKIHKVIECDNIIKNSVAAVITSARFIKKCDKKVREDLASVSFVNPPTREGGPAHTDALAQVGTSPEPKLRRGPVTPPNISKSINPCEENIIISRLRFRQE